METKFDLYTPQHSVSFNRSDCCRDCGAIASDPSTMGFFARKFSSNVGSNCFNCNKLLCAKCADQNCLLVHPAGLNEVDSFTLSNYNQYKSHGCCKHSQKKEMKRRVKELFNRDNVQSFCLECYKKQSSIDFSRTYDAYGPIGGAPVVLAHAFPLSRMMFAHYANELANKKGYRCYAFDFPGHGSRTNEPLTLDSCLKAIRDAAELAIKEDPQHRKPMYVGVSFGAYVGFKALATSSDLFSCAIMSDCQVNFGGEKHCGPAFMMKMMKWWLPKVSNRKITEGMLSHVPTKGDADLKLISQSMFQPGISFQHILSALNIVESIDVVSLIPRFNGAFLFLNGPEPNHHGQVNWLELCAKKERSKLKYKHRHHHHHHRHHDPHFGKEAIDESITEAIAFYEIEQYQNQSLITAKIITE